MTDRTKCPKCGGTGRAPLDESLQEALNYVRLWPGSTSIKMSKINTNSGVGVTAINQRLERLRKFGFVRRERHGKSWAYFPTKKTKQKP